MLRPLKKKKQHFAEYSGGSHPDASNVSFSQQADTNILGTRLVHMDVGLSLIFELMLSQLGRFVSPTNGS